MVRMRKAFRDDLEHLRDLLIMTRKGMGLSQTDVRRMLGASSATVSRYESGDRDVAGMIIQYLYILRPALFYGVIRALEDCLYGVRKDEEDRDG